MERYNIFLIIKTVIFSLIIVLGLWIMLTASPYGVLNVAFFGGLVIIVGILGLVISLAVWGAKASKK